MEAMYPASYLLDSSLFMAKGGGREEWSREENKAFERALAMVDEATPDRWYKVAEMIPGRSVSDVIAQYQELVADVNNIEAGLVPVPGYLASSLTFDLMGSPGFDNVRKRGRSSSIDQERRKGVPWTEEEHRRFLMGLQAFGKGDWRNISRKFVISKTPTQVASHAQKYFLRQYSGGKDKKRPSIHDITTVNLLHASAPLQDTKCGNFGQKPPNESKIWLDKDSDEEFLMVIDDDSVGSLHGRNYAANHCIANSKFQIQPRQYVL
jgi:SHAQKYF class myb-like DNA-binding protein